jgi:hypothetical protein
MPTIVFEEKSGARRPLIVERDLIVLPGVHDMTEEQWEKVQSAFGAKGYIERKELYDDANPPPREKRKPTTPAKPPAAKQETEDNSPEEIREFVAQISKMKVDEAEQYIVGLDVKPALVALLAKDNRQAIKDMAKARLEFLNGAHSD